MASLASCYGMGIRQKQSLRRQRPDSRAGWKLIKRNDFNQVV